MRVFVFLALLLVPTAAQAALVSFDDIEFWVGSGANRAAVAIDWGPGTNTPPALVWGYRWDGAASGADMFQAVVSADKRLFTKIQNYSWGTAIYGIGYDYNANGSFALDDGTSFGASGIAVVTASSDGSKAVEAGDLYQEGWFTGTWNYGVAAQDTAGNPTNPFAGGAWSGSSSGAAARQLSNDDWDSWAFTPGFDSGVFASNPIAASSAVPEPGAGSLLALGLGGMSLYRRRRTTTRLAAKT